MNERIEELERICQEYPKNIPIHVVADFLGTSVESLRTAIAQGKTSFAAFSWCKPGKSNRGFLIPTLAFYNAMRGN